ncbi:MAG: signal recognition particle-docking protein FtsY, partial [Clostridiales bacterium]|nr:signal recognition particle-docking protein FtsY [Clostridiales bacterium]
LKDEIDKNHVRDTATVRDLLKNILVELLEENEKPEYDYPLVIMLSGVNGVGKTTAIGKLAKKFKKMGKSVTIAAADTFRAAAADQLTVWAERAGVRIIKHAEGADPAAVVYDAAQSVRSKKGDVLLVDTAGRLHNKKNLMEELKKISRVVDRELPDATVYNYIVLDATTGQNAISQVDLFNEAIDIDGIVLTKLDGTAKGGVVLAIAGELNVPVVYVGVGEGIDDLEDFDAEDFVAGIMGDE